MKRFVYASLCILFVTGAQAQKKISHFYLLPQVALLSGDKYTGTQASLNLGVEKNNIAVGIGVALDNYQIRTIPVFATFRAGAGKSKAFVYAAAGPDLMWLRESQYSYHIDPNSLVGRRPGPGLVRDRFSTGFYGDVGLGYSFRIGKKYELPISVGYSLKTAHQSYPERIQTQFAPFTEVYEHKLTYRLNRIALRLGFKL